MSEIIKARKAKVTRVTFEKLVGSIQAVHRELASQASRAVNLSLTLRNWLIGGHIAEYELHGADRASYGDRLLEKLSAKLETLQLSGCGKRQLYQYLRFYQAYPEIVRSASAQFGSLLPERIGSDSGKVRSLTAQSRTDPSHLVQQLAYTHLEQLVAIEDPAARAFYETECIRGGWSVRELKRQMASLYFERTALSQDKAKLAKLAHQQAEVILPQLTIRDPYIFEFLGLRSQEVMSESHLEDQLLDKLQDFLLELGHGFCFEARQKRILIGDKHGFVDLVFYHRILKCHVASSRPRTVAARTGATLAGVQRMSVTNHRRARIALRIGQIRQLAERDATPLPQLTDEVATLASRVDEHLNKMGFST